MPVRPSRNRHQITARIAEWLKHISLTRKNPKKTVPSTQTSTQSTKILSKAWASSALLIALIAGFFSAISQTHMWFNMPKYVLRGFARLFILTVFVSAAVSNVQAQEATGGTVTTVPTGDADGSQYVYHTFTTGGTFTVTADGPMDYLIVGGGGGGGSGRGDSGVNAGGGGAGGMIDGSQTLTTGSYTITVGGGGAARDVNSNTRGGNGGNSTAFGFAAIGGGGGASRTPGGGTGGGNGGSGGGQAFNDNPGSGTPGQGTNGLDGGGGAGSASVNANGGNGRAWVDGNTYAGGGE